jgi:adenylate kinase family enzyme
MTSLNANNLYTSTRIAIAGNSGSGKSTFARQLASSGSIPILDLDTLAWEPDEIAVPRPVEQAATDVREFCESNEQWIVEGCYARLIVATLSCDPHLVVLDPGLEQCVTNCRTRPWEPHKYQSKEEQDSRLAYLLAWVEEYYTRDDDMSLAAHKKLYRHYDGPKQWLSGLPPQTSTMAVLPNATIDTEI